MSETHAPISPLLATAAVHAHLVREGARTMCGLVVESGEPREAMHFALLLGYGAAAVNPYLALESLRSLHADGELGPLTLGEARERYLAAVGKSLLKICSKMGISTVQSYRGAQIFEAIGLGRRIVDRYFTGTVSRVGGLELPDLHDEIAERHEAAFAPGRGAAVSELDPGGEYQQRRRGEHHAWNPDTIAGLQRAVRDDAYATFKEYADALDASTRLQTLRGLLEIVPAAEPIPLQEVEPSSEIVRRFATGAMALGSLSPEAHETLGIAMNRIGGRSNTGEGGEDLARSIADANGDLRRSAIKQVASGRFGVTTEYLRDADQLQIKVAQGAKPGEGGQLPGHKVDDLIARLRHATPGVGLISPPPHHDIYSIEDLAQLIHDLKSVNPAARGRRQAGRRGRRRHRRGGRRQGEGRAPRDRGARRRHRRLTALVAEARRAAVGARPRRDAAGAGDERPPRPRPGADRRRPPNRPRRRDRRAARRRGVRVLDRAAGRARLRDDARLPPEHVPGRDRDAGSGAAATVHRTAGARGASTCCSWPRSVRELMAAVGVRRFDELVGRTDLLRPVDARQWPWLKDLDLEPLLHRPDVPGPRVRTEPQEHGLEQAADHRWMIAVGAAERGEAVEIDDTVRNTDRSVGAMLAGELARLDLDDDAIAIRLDGTGGQSFGAFAVRGMTLTLAGVVNDYCGKGLSGGRLVVAPAADAGYVAEEHVVCGNVALYGATSGEAYFRGRAGERFAVRNSGATAVVEGVGDHGCEYMTGGVVAILGAVGRNFAAGMSGGLAYLLRDGLRPDRINDESVALVDVEDPEALTALLARHRDLTGSGVAARLLARPELLAAAFVQVLPNDLRRARESAPDLAATA